jgi:hypothetical protein
LKQNTVLREIRSNQLVIYKKFNPGDAFLGMETLNLNRGLNQYLRSHGWRFNQGISRRRRSFLPEGKITGSGDQRNQYNCCY